MRAFSKLTDRVDGELRIVSDPPLIVPIEELFSGEQLGEADEARSEASSTNTARPSARRVATSSTATGTSTPLARWSASGSVGTRAWIALFVGRDESDPLFLQIKEAQESVLEPYTAPSEFPITGERVVEGQRLMQAASDILLGWLSAGPDGTSATSTCASSGTRRARRRSTRWRRRR